MKTIKPSIETSSSLSDWLTEAVHIARRFKDRLRGSPPRRQKLQPRSSRLILSDQRCLELAGLARPVVVAAEVAG